MILVDTSAWVERDRSTGSTLAERLDRLLKSDEEVCVTEPIAMELMAGSLNPVATRRNMLGAVHLPFESETDFTAASAIYRVCRKRGHTPRSMVDCLIAAVAIRTGVSLLARDSDFERIAESTPLKLIRA